MNRTALSFIAALLISAPAYAAPFTAVIARCHDGDTCKTTASITIRIQHIDAPERAFRGKWSDQPGAWQATEAINTLLDGHTVTITPAGYESHQRMVADISIAGMDVGREMVREGLALADPCFTRDRSYLALQHEAQADNRGIWADPKQPPVAPWDWRSEHTTGHQRLACPRGRR